MSQSATYSLFSLYPLHCSWNTAFIISLQIPGFACEMQGKWLRCDVSWRDSLFVWIGKRVESSQTKAKEADIFLHTLNNWRYRVAITMRCESSRALPRNARTIARGGSRLACRVDLQWARPADNLQTDWMHWPWLTGQHWYKTDSMCWGHAFQHNGCRQEYGTRKCDLVIAG